MEIARLLANELQGGNIPMDREKLIQWLEEDEQNRKLYEWLKQDEQLNREVSLLEATDTNGAWQRLSILLQQHPQAKTAFWEKTSFRIAASVIFILAFTGWIFWFSGKNDNTQQTTTQLTPGFQNDVAPGGNKALLTLADGSVVVLEDVTNGTIISNKGATEVRKMNNGELLYEEKRKNEQSIAGIHTLTTPRGGQYQLILPDGSKVWLNAASKLKYPSSFTGNERVVELEGEAYFEVKGNPQKPFRVNTRFQQTTVVGTHFNINSYEDEPAEVITLAEGKVKVHRKGGGPDQATELEPGRQAIVKDEIRTGPANVEGIVAWKDGIFQFEETELPVIMRQLARWYDVDVKYVNQGTKTRFSGKLPKTLSLNTLLKILDLSDVKFRVEGRTITVL